MATAGIKERERKAEALDRICTQLAAGVPPSEIRPELAVYEVADRTIRNWFQEAHARLGREAGVLRETYLGRSLMRLEFLWQWAVRDGDRQEARKIEKDVREMLGLNEAVTIEHRIPAAWHGVFDELGIRRPGNGTGDGADGGEDESPQVRH